MLELCVQNYRKIFDDTKEKVPPTLFPDMIDTLEKLKEKGIVCTIATSRNSKSLNEFLNKMNIVQYVGLTIQTIFIMIYLIYLYNIYYYKF